MHAVPLLFVGTIKIQRDDHRKMKQHKKKKSIIIAVITTQAGPSNALWLATRWKDR